MKTRIFAVLWLASLLSAHIAFGAACAAGTSTVGINPIETMAAAARYQSFAGLLYGDATSDGSNDMSSVTGGATHLSDGQKLAKGTAVTGGPSGITPRCTNGALPSGGVCGDGSVATIGIVGVGMSSHHREWCVSNAQTTAGTVGGFKAQCLKYSLLDQIGNAADRVDASGVAYNQSTVFAGNVTFADGSQEAMGYNQWTGSASPTSCAQTGAPACSTSGGASDPWDVLIHTRVPNYAVTGTASQALSVNQVQVILMKDTFQTPGTGNTMASLSGSACTTSNILGGGGTDVVACDIEREIGIMARELLTVFPNLQMIFIGNRMYEGYATAGVNPPTCGYETGYGVKWAVQGQISQTANSGTVQDSVADDLCYKTPCPSAAIAPWIGYGPTFWANGITTANAYGVTYTKGATGAVKDYNPADFTHPSTYGTASGQTQVAPMGTMKMAYQWIRFMIENATTTSGGDTTLGGTGLTCEVTGSCAGASPTPTITPTPVSINAYPTGHLGMWSAGGLHMR